MLHTEPVGPFSIKQRHYGPIQWHRKYLWAHLILHVEPMGSSNVILRPSLPIQCHAESVSPFHVMYTHNLWAHPMSDNSFVSHGPTALGITARQQILHLRKKRLHCNPDNSFRNWVPFPHSGKTLEDILNSWALVSFSKD